MAHGGVKIEVNLDKSKLQGSLKGLEGEMVKSMAIFEVMKQTLTKVFGMITDSVDQAMRRIDTMDQFSRVMSTMTGSTDKANAALERTNAIVQGTAFGLDTAAKGVQAFVASGMEVSKATDTMEAWGDAVAFYTKGTNAELETVSAALQKMQTKGNVTMEHMQMMLEAGIPAIQIYASAVGKSTEEVTDQMSKGELKTEDFIVAMNGAFKAGTAGFPAIAGAAKQAGASWQGSQDNMRAAIARGTAAMLEQLDAVFDVKGGMVNFGKTMEKVLKTLAQNLDVLIPLAVGAVGAIMAFKGVQAVIAGFNALKTAIGGVSAFYKAFNAATIAMKAGVEGAAASVKQMNAALSATIAGAVIAGVVALMAVMDALSNRVTEYNDIVSDGVAAAEDQHQANQSLIESMQGIRSEYENETAMAEQTAIASRNLTDELAKMQEQYKNSADGSNEQAEAQIRMKQITNELNGSISGLGLAFDETTGSVNMSNDAINDAIDRQERYNKAVAGLKYVNELRGKEIELKAQQAITEKKLAAVQEDSIELLEGQETGFGAVVNILSKGGPQALAWTKSVKRVIDSTEELTDDQIKLAEQMQFAAEVAEEQARLYLEDLQAMNANGEGVEDLARQYGISVSEIESWMQGHKKGLQDWQDYHETTLNDAGENIEQVAARWGMTVDAIQAVMDENGISLQAWEDEQEKILEEWNNAVQANKDLVINGMKELPTEMEYSLDDMIEVMTENAEKYDAWRGKMAQVSSKLSPEVMSYLEQLGPGTSKILDDIINDTTGDKAYELNLAFQKVGESAVAGVEGTYPAVQAAGMGMMDNAATGMSASDAPNAASQAVADGVVSNLSNADYSTITEAMANAIKSGTNAVQNAAQSMANAIIKILTDMSNKSQTTTVQMMTKITTTISGRVSVVRSAMLGAANAVNTVLQSMATQAGATALSMMNAIVSSIQSQGAAVSSAIRSVIIAARSTADGAADWGSLGYSIVSGIASGVRNNAGILAQAVRDVVQQGLNAGKAKAEVNSPSRLFGRELGLPISEGVAEYIAKGSPDAVTSIQKMINDMTKASTRGVSVNVAAGVAAQSVAASSAANISVQNALLHEQNTILSKLLNKDMSVKIGNRVVAQAANEGNKDMGAHISKGAFSNAY